MSMLESLRNGVNLWDPYLLVCIVLLVVCFVVPFHKKRKIKKQIQDLANNATEMSPEEFFRMRNFSLDGRKSYAKTLNFAGVYILYNKTKHLYYVARANRSSIGSMPILPVTGMGMCMQTTNAEIPFPFERSNWRVADAKHSTSWNGMQS